MVRLRTTILGSAVMHTVLFIGLMLEPTRELIEKPIQVELIVPPRPEAKSDTKTGEASKRIKKLFKLSRETGPVGDSGIDVGGSGGGVKRGGKRFQDTGNPLTDEKNIYSTYYDRIRAKLDGIWQDRARTEVINYFKKYKKKMPNRVTVVEITLDSTGYVVSCRVISESGDQKLDEIALEAFRSANVFPNPPKDLLTDGKMTFDWMFIIIL